MDTQIVYLPFNEKCNILAFVEADYLQRITVTDLEKNEKLFTWEAQGAHQTHAPVELITGSRGADPTGYRVQVKIESTPNRSQEWKPSTIAMFSGGRVPWGYCTVGSEDCGSTDKDWNDASVCFVFERHLFDPLFSLAPWRKEGERHRLEA